MINSFIEKIRTKKPLVHCITNTVTINDCANILVAIGASPIMAHHINEVSEVTQNADAFMCNLGATDYYDSIEASICTANKNAIPVIMDPVGIAVSSYRRSFALDMLKKHHIDCVRGNYSEIMALIENVQTAPGLDNKANKKDLNIKGIVEFSRLHDSMFFMTGASDYIIYKDEILVPDESAIASDQRSNNMLTKISGSGCMLSALTGAYLAVEKSAKALESLSLFYRKSSQTATEIALKASAGSMSFKAFFIDEISKTDLI